MIPAIRQISNFREALPLPGPLLPLAATMKLVPGSARALACSNRRPRRLGLARLSLPSGAGWSDAPPMAREGAGHCRRGPAPSRNTGGWRKMDHSVRPSASGTTGEGAGWNTRGACAPRTELNRSGLGEAKVAWWPKRLQVDLRRSLVPNCLAG